MVVTQVPFVYIGSQMYMLRPNKLPIFNSPNPYPMGQSKISFQSPKWLRPNLDPHLKETKSFA
ncbi:hypothetical protein HanIR_Chr05g0235311 [Helianthus annuus]|nr:hypothetical protein HanIR_Chr05g0235311 [Helianthus annuus]